MTEIISETGYTIREMAEKTGLSYGYMRRIVNGTVIPNRDALKRLCDGLGLDFATEWKATHPSPQEEAAEAILSMMSAAGSEDSPAQGEAHGDFMPFQFTIDTADKAKFFSDFAKQELLKAFDRLTLQRKLDLMRFANQLEKEKGDTFTG
jgi:transcriptional regulator with XRE-family HTH domain